MENIHYKVAGHSFVIYTDQKEDIYKNLPSYQPFYEENVAESPVFRLEVVKSQPELHGKEVYRFIWEGAGYVIYQGEKGYTFEIFPYKAIKPYLIRIEKNFRKAFFCLQGNGKTDFFALSNCLMIMYAFATAPSGTLMVHASVTINSEKAYLFLGKSGTGKSTHSQLWKKYIPGSELLNDDNPIVRFLPEGTIVSGSPWSGKTPCYRNLQWPVGAFVKLTQAPQNQITRLKPSLAFAMLLSSCSAMKWDKPIYDGICKSVSEIAGTVPFFALDCLPDREAAELCYHTVTYGKFEKNKAAQ